MSEELRKKGLAFAMHFTRLTGVACFGMDIEARELFVDGPIFCDGCECGRCNHVTTHRYGSTEAYRWNGMYIYYCPLGLVFIASPLKAEKIKPTLALIAGPVIIGDPLDAQELASQERPPICISDTPHFDAPRANALATVLSASTSGLSGISHAPAISDNSPAYVKLLKKESSEKGVHDDLIQFENRLKTLVRAGKKEESQALLNELLGRIYFYSGFRLDLIKARALELVVILSRAVIEAGANIEDILALNTHSLRDVESTESIDELGAFLTELLHRFISYSFDFAEAKHLDVVYKVKEYVKNNYMHKLTLDDIARHAFLSRSYLSSMFKTETGTTLSAYINLVRIDRSKALLKETPLSLLDIAYKCGFEDQSYFSKVFKSLTGITPKQYRAGAVRIT